MVRDYKLDFIRVASMFLVIVIHISNIYSRNFANISLNSYFFATLFNGLSRIAVPLFFMISGSLLIGKKEDYKKSYLRVKKIILVLLAWSLIYYFWDIFVMGYDKPLLKTLITSFFTPMKAHLWFMYALIGFYIILPFIRKIFHNTNVDEDKLFIYLWVFFTGFLYVLRLLLQTININVSIMYPVPLVQGTYYLGYFVLGYVLYKYLNEIKLSERSLITIFIASLSFVVISTFGVSIIVDGYYEGMFAYRSLFYNLMAASAFVYILKYGDFIDYKLKKIIEFISPYSFGIYLSHVLFLNLLNKLEITIVHSLVGIPVYSISLFIISFILVYFLKQIKYIKEII